MDAILGRELQIVLPIEGERRNLKVKVPRGIEDGKKIRLKGQGAKSPTGGPPGDLLIEVKIKKDRKYERIGDDLRKEERITIGEAYHGTTKEIDTPWGKVKVTVPKGTQGGSKLRLKGRGVKSGGRVGDLYIQVVIEIPNNREKRTKDAVDKLEKCY
jgi:DnaJ-class molecular chaperone